MTVAQPIPQLIASSGLAQRQSLPLEAKVAMSKARIRAWIDHFDGDVYLCLSGGQG